MTQIAAIYLTKAAALFPRSIFCERKRATTSEHAPDPIKPESVEEDLTASLTWAQRLKRVFSLDNTLCPKCGGRLRVITDVTDPVIIQKILDHVAQPPQSTRTGTAYHQLPTDRIDEFPSIAWLCLIKIGIKHLLNPTSAEVPRGYQILTTSLPVID